MSLYCLLRPPTWPWVAKKGLALSRSWVPSSAAVEHAVLRDKQSDLSQHWCAERSIRTEHLAQRLPFHFTALKISDCFPEVIMRARERRAICPIDYGGPGNLDLLFSLARSIGAQTIVETGVAFGWSSLAFLLALQSAGDEHVLMSVDMPFLSQWNDKWAAGAVPAELRSCWRRYRLPDRQGLPRALHSCHTVDMGHYDSDKSYGGRMFGYRTIWDALRAGGILVSDDIEDNCAFKTFAEDVGRSPMVLKRDGKYQGLLIK